MVKQSFVFILFWWSATVAAKDHSVKWKSWRTGYERRWHINGAVTWILIIIYYMSRMSATLLRISLHKRQEKSPVCELVLCFILQLLVCEFLIYYSHTDIVLSSTCYISYHTTLVFKWIWGNKYGYSLLFVFCIFRVINSY